MKLLLLKPYFNALTSLKNAIILLGIIALLSSLGTIIEQDETLAFYQTNYSSTKPIYGFIDWKLITNPILGLDHIYTSWWFLFLLVLLSISLSTCTITRQFPIFITSKDYIFKKNQSSVKKNPFFIRFQKKLEITIPKDRDGNRDLPRNAVFIYPKTNISDNLKTSEIIRNGVGKSLKSVNFLKPYAYLNEIIVGKLQKIHFYLYQRKNILYGYKGLIGRISPILVHVSLLIILFGSLFSAFINFKAQEMVPKSEIFHIQNPIKVGTFTNMPFFSTRVNDFWVEYEDNRIHQFYSNLSILDEMGKEVKEQTISVNNPLRYQQIDFYQSDWNLLAIRIKNLQENKIYEFPLFSFSKDEKSKSWITWIPTEGLLTDLLLSKKTNYVTLIINQFQDIILIYDQFGKFLMTKSIGEYLVENQDFAMIELLPSTGLLVKYDPMIGIIYFGFGLLMITALLSYLPYTQIWVSKKKKYTLIASTTNRGKIQLEIEFENVIRFLENKKNLKVKV